MEKYNGQFHEKWTFFRHIYNGNKMLWYLYDAKNYIKFEYLLFLATELKKKKCEKFQVFIHIIQIPLHFTGVMYVTKS